jgi:hypothetical protein
MVRRTVLIATILGTVSAAGALAAVSDLVPKGWGFLRGFTPAPSSLDDVRGTATVFPQLYADSAERGEFCPLPLTREPGSSLDSLATVATASDSSSDLFLEGLSRTPSAAADSVCTGDTVSTNRLPVRK